LEEPGDLSSLRRHLEWGWAARQHGQLHVRLRDGRDSTLLETPGMTEALPPDSFPPPLPSSPDPASGARAVRSAQGKPLRLLAARAPGGHVVQVGLDRTAEQELLARYRRRLWLVLGLALPVCAAGGYQIARRGVRPLEEVTATARRIQPA